jgi:cell division protein FtsB
LIRICAVASALASVAIVAAALAGPHGVAKHDKLRSELASVRTLNDSLRAENAKLRRETNALRTNSEFIESAIRDELGWVRKNEVIIMFDDDVAQKGTLKKP